jgi:hypothetical protein
MEAVPTQAARAARSAGPGGTEPTAVGKDHLAVGTNPLWNQPFVARP